MPPKPKFNKEEIVYAGLDIARERGISEVKARDVGDKLGCSSRPIFTFFASMEELQKAVEDEAWKVFRSYLAVADNYLPAFKMRGMQMIKFAQNEPKLFQLLFMTEKKPIDFNDLMKTRINGFANDIDTIKKEFNVTDKEAMQLFNHIWVFAYGMCTLCATKVCTFTDEEIAAMLGHSFASTVMLIKSNKIGEFDFKPIQKNGNENPYRLEKFPVLQAEE